MPDYYTKFAVWIPLYTEAEVLWWKRAELVHVPMLWGGEDHDDSVEGKEFFLKHRSIWENFEGETICEIYTRDDARFPHGLVCITDDSGSGNIDGTAHLIQAYLKDFDTKKPVAFMWGEDCDRHRPDGFGGGACYVSQDEIRIESAFAIVERWMQEDKVPLTVNYHDSAPYGVGSAEDDQQPEEEGQP